MAAILPVYYQQVAAVGVPEHLRTAYWGYTQSVGLLIIALAAPLLGAAADYLGIKKKFLSFFVAIGVTASALLYFVTEGDWLFASLVFIVGNIGFAGSNQGGRGIQHDHIPGGSILLTGENVAGDLGILLGNATF